MFVIIKVVSFDKFILPGINLFIKISIGSLRVISVGFDRYWAKNII